MFAVDDIIGWQKGKTGEGGYGRAAALRTGRIQAWLAERRAVNTCFNNDACGHALQDARQLRGLVDNNVLSG
jgi:hypothetical protein